MHGREWRCMLSIIMANAYCVNNSLSSSKEFWNFWRILSETQWSAICFTDMLERCFITFSFVNLTGSSYVEIIQSQGVFQLLISMRLCIIVHKYHVCAHFRNKRLDKTARYIVALLKSFYWTRGKNLSLCDRPHTLLLILLNRLCHNPFLRCLSFSTEY